MVEGKFCVQKHSAILIPATTNGTSEYWKLGFKSWSIMYHLFCDIHSSSYIGSFFQVAAFIFFFLFLQEHSITVP